jgi:tetratricopeptide (TPR) repeat protein
MLERVAPGRPIGDALAEGSDAGVVDARGTRVQFAHPAYARMLIGALSPGDRRHAHHRIGEALLDSAPGTATAFEIASHFVKAGDVAPPREVLRVAQQGGDEAMASCAWREAAECYEAAAAALERTDGMRLDVAADLHFRAALCWMWNLDDDRAIVEFDAAIDRFSAAGDTRAIVRARLERLRVVLSRVSPLEPVDASVVEAAIAELGPDDPLRAQALADLGMAYAVSGRVGDAPIAARAALDLAGDHAPRAAARARVALSLSAWTDLAFEDALEHLNAAIVDSDASGDAYGHLAAAARRAITLLWLGRLEEADEVAATALAVGREHNLVFGMVFALAARACAACFSDRVHEAAAFAEEVVLRRRLGDFAWGLPFSQPTYAALQALTNGAEAGHAVLREWAMLRRIDAGGYPWGDFTDVYDVAVDLLADPALRRGAIPLPAWVADTPLSGALSWSGISAAIAEIAWWKQDPTLAKNARGALQHCDSAGMVVVDGWLASVPRALGIATAAAGDVDEGRRLVGRARDWAGAARANLEYSLCGWWECELARAAGVSPSDEAVAAARESRMS